MMPWPVAGMEPDQPDILECRETQGRIPNRGEGRSFPPPNKWKIKYTPTLTALLAQSSVLLCLNLSS